MRKAPVNLVGHFFIAWRGEELHAVARRGRPSRPSQAIVIVDNRRRYQTASFIAHRFEPLGQHPTATVTV